MTRQQIGAWRVIWRAPQDDGTHTLWTCRCACGKVAALAGTDLRQGGTYSCGCMNRAQAMAYEASVRRVQRDVSDTYAWIS